MVWFVIIVAGAVTWAVKAKQSGALETAVSFVKNLLNKGTHGEGGEQPPAAPPRHRGTRPNQARPVAPVIAAGGAPDSPTATVLAAPPPRYPTQFVELPEFLIAEVIARLPVDDRLRAESVCRAWRRAGRRPASWAVIDCAPMAAAPALLPRHIVRLLQRAAAFSPAGDPVTSLRVLALPHKAEAYTPAYLRDVLRHSACLGLRELRLGAVDPAAVLAALDAAPAGAVVSAELRVTFDPGDTADRTIAAARAASELCAHARTAVTGLTFQSRAAAARPPARPPALPTVPLPSSAFGDDDGERDGLDAAGAKPMQLPAAAWTACASAVLALAARSRRFSLATRGLAVHAVFLASITAARPLCHLVESLALEATDLLASPPDTARVLDVLGDHLAASDCCLRSLTVTVVAYPPDSDAPDGAGPGRDAADNAAFLLAALASNTSLTSLGLSSHRPGVPQLAPSEGSFMEAISTALVANAALRTLSLTNLSLTARPPPAEALSEDEDRERLVAAFRANYRLGALRLRGCGLGPERAAEALAAAVGASKSLVELEIRECGLRDPGAAQLASALRAGGAARVARLRLVDNALTRRGARALLESLKSAVGLRLLAIDQDGVCFDPAPEDAFTAADTLRAAADALRFNLTLVSLELTPVSHDDPGLARVYRAEIAKQLAANSGGDPAAVAAKRKAAVRLIADGVQRDTTAALRLGAASCLRAVDVLAATLRALAESGTTVDERLWAHARSQVRL